MKKQTASLLVLTAVSILAAVLLVAADGPAGFLNALRSASPYWLAAALGLMLLYWLLEAVALHLPLRRLHPGQRFRATLQTSMIGQLFNCITPFASGGQPIQAYHLTRGGVPLGTASCVLLAKFIVYQCVLTAYSLVTLILRFRFFQGRVQNLGWLVLVGFGVNAAVIAGLLCLSCFPQGTKRFLHGALGLLTRLRLIKQPGQAGERLNRSLADLYAGLAEIGKNVGVMLQMAMLTAVQLTAFFLIPLMLYYSFGLTGMSAFSILAAGAFVLNLTSFVPLPGAAGGAELGFSLLFALFFPARVLAASALL